MNRYRRFFTSSILALLWLPALPAMVVAGPLNDTGIRFCGDAASGNNEPCLGSEPAGQDAHYGRDAAAAAGTLSKIGGGGKGFDYTKIANNGSELPESASLGSAPGDWACSRDNVTGLTWEVKVDDISHPRHQGHTYTWYDSQSPDGNLGSLGFTTSCNNSLAGQTCNTENYVEMVRAASLCGRGDWRMPTIKELRSIVDFGRWNPAIDPTYFPNTLSLFFWSGSPHATYCSDIAWTVSFDYGYAYHGDRVDGLRVRLVHGGQ